MARTLTALAAATLVVAASACLKVVDVVQPLEVRAGSTFEVTVAVQADFDRFASEEPPAFGMLAASVPAGIDVQGGRFSGAAEGKLRRLPGDDYRPAAVRDGYEWQVFRTRERYRGPELAGRAVEVKLKLKAGAAPGDYCLAYAAGVAPVGPGGEPDPRRLAWQELAPGAAAARWITVK